MAAVLLFALSYIFVARAGMSPFVASTLAYGIAFVCAYFAQRGWTFGASHSHGHALPRYLATQLVCALLAGVVSHLAVHGASATPIFMSVVSTAISSAASYLLTSLWVFPQAAERAG